ncbi:MAG: hypothetical protein WA924_08920 [Burkholderiaceae bacterium]
MKFLNDGNSLRWSHSQASRRACIFNRDQSLHGLLHLNLKPQPYVGNIETASVFVLLANPGFSPSDYDDDHVNLKHMAACDSNLRQEGIGFYPLLPESANTGAGRYWLRRLGTLERTLAEKAKISLPEARNLLVQQFAVIEAGPYHSKSFPGAWHDRLSSSRAARHFVRQSLIPRARDGSALILVLRRVSFWRLSPNLPGVLVREPKQAQLSNFLKHEADAMTSFLAELHHARAQESTEHET